jgi:hypothetical protein
MRGLNFSFFLQFPFFLQLLDSYTTFIFFMVHIITVKQVTTTSEPLLPYGAVITTRFR